MIYKIPTHRKRAYLLIGTVCLLTFFSSCTGTGESNNKSDEIGVETKETESLLLKSAIDECTINTTQVINWNTYRKDSNEVMALFNNIGNIFSFSKNWDSEVDTAVHAYLGVDPDLGNLSLTLINAGTDVKENRNCIDAVDINKTKKDLPRFEVIHINRDSISYVDAKNRIDAWNDSTIRNNWIQERFKNNPDSTSILQVFVLNGENLSYGDTHDCYLGLKLDSLKNNYTADLILVNYNEDEPDSLRKNLEDLANPCPPFKAGTNLDKSLFGLIEAFNLN